MTELDPPTPDILLERYRLNELPAIDAARVAERLRHDAELRARLDMLDRSDEEIRRAHLLDDLVRAVHSRAAAPAAGSADATKSSLAYWLAPAVIVVGVMLLIGVVLRPAVGPGDTPPGANVDDSGDRIKGFRPALVLYRRTADGSEMLADGSIVRSGDVVRVGYRAAGRAFGVIVSVDGRGGVTVHLPARGDRAVALKSDSMVLLDAAYELDDAPRWEQFYFITGDTLFAVQPVVDAARTLGTTTSATPPPLLLPHGLDQATFSLQKEVRR